VAKVFIIFSSHCPARYLADFTVQRTIPLSAGIPLILVDIYILAKIMPSAKIVVFRGFLAEKSEKGD